MTESQQPSLSRNRSFYHFIGTQGLGAFNDNLFKQIVLLLCLGSMFVGVEFQAVVQFCFALPFLLLSGLAGDLSDKFSKGTLMVLCKAGEAFVMLMALTIFLLFASDSPVEKTPILLGSLAFTVFLMGAQSAFFGPPKYGGLPELVRRTDISQATGLTQMTTFLAIIFGIAIAGYLMDEFSDRLWIPASCAVGTAILGILVSLGIQRVPASDPARKISGRSFLSVVPTLKKIFRTDPLMTGVMILYSWFWLVGSVTLSSINVLGRLQLGLSNLETSAMVSMLSVGIALGSVTVGRLSKGHIRLDLMAWGVVGLILCMFLIIAIPVHSPSPEEVDRLVAGEEGVIPLAPVWVRVIAFGLLILTGVSGGFYSVPLLAFVQNRPKDSERGRSFAAVNWLNWVFIVAAAGVYGVLINLTNKNAHYVFAITALLSAVINGFAIPIVLRRLRLEANQKKEEEGAPAS